VQALDLRMADLFSGARTARARGEIVATYDYHDRDGVLVAQKVRYLPKRFAWRRPDASARVGWRWGLNGPVPGLYRWPELIDAPVVFLTEGEKAADLLRNVGLVATCPPAGVSSWAPAWSEHLLETGRRQLVILADADRAGEQHAERVAATTSALPCDEPIMVKVVRLPGLPPGSDVVDWLEGGQSREDLFAVVASTPVWLPNAQERRRVDIRRAQTRVRVSRHRAQNRAATGGNGNAARNQATLAMRNAVTRDKTRERVRRHRAKVRAAQAVSAEVAECNAPDVTCNAVTHCERTSSPLQESLSKEPSLNIHSVTKKSVTEEWDTAQRDTEAGAVGPRCCESGVLQLRGQLCPQSPMYWQRRDSEAPRLIDLAAFRRLDGAAGGHGAT
jgi:hypothetical protein